MAYAKRDTQSKLQTHSDIKKSKLKDRSTSLDRRHMEKDEKKTSLSIPHGSVRPSRSRQLASEPKTEPNKNIAKSDAKKSTEVKTFSNAEKKKKPVASKKRTTTSLSQNQQPSSKALVSKVKSKGKISIKNKSQSIGLNKIEPGFQTNTKTYRPVTSTIQKISSLDEKAKEQESEGAVIAKEDLKNQDEYAASLTGHHEENDLDEYEDDFENSATDEDSNFSGEEELADVQKSSSSTTSDDSIAPATEDMPKSSGLITHPTIVKRQSDAVFLNTGRKVKTKFLQMSSRSSTFVKSIDAKVQVLQPSHSFINFAAAVKEQELILHSEKLKKRGKDLSSLITFDECSYSNIELPPMQYDIYIKQFGKSAAKQVIVFTEYGEHEETETEAVEEHQKWTQNPPYDKIGVGGELSNLPLHNESWQQIYHSEAIKLELFLQQCTPIVLRFLKEAFFETLGDSVTETPSETGFSHSQNTVIPISICRASDVTYICNPTKPSTYFLTIYADKKNLPSDCCSGQRKGIICVWNSLDHNHPESVLGSNSQPTCACFSPYCHDVVFAGMVDGSVMLWDLNEPFYINGSYYENTPIRNPTYNTASFVTENHHCCIVAMQTFEYSVSQSSHLFDAGDHASSYHVLTLDEMALLNIWIAVEIHWNDQTMYLDFGLSPGGKMKLVWSSSISLVQNNIMGQLMPADLRSFDFQVFPGNKNHILVTTDVGTVHHIVRSGNTPEIMYFICSTGLRLEVKFIQFSPHDTEMFLVGCSDGSAMLFSMKKSFPVLVIRNVALGEQIRCMKWCPHSPSVFLVLDIASVLHIWNVKYSLRKPEFSYAFLYPRVLWFIVMEIDKYSSLTAEDTAMKLVVGKEDGEIQIHNMQKKFDCDVEEFADQMNFMKSL